MVEVHPFSHAQAHDGVQALWGVLAAGKVFRDEPDIGKGTHGSSSSFALGCWPVAKLG